MRRKDWPHRRTVGSGREAAAGQKEHPADEGAVRGRARKVRADERVTDGEGEGGSEEEQSDKDCGLADGCRGRRRSSHGRPGRGGCRLVEDCCFHSKYARLAYVVSSVYFRRKVVKDSAGRGWGWPT